jgi:hypothetical protein
MEVILRFSQYNLPFKSFFIICESSPYRFYESLLHKDPRVIKYKIMRVKMIKSLEISFRFTQVFRKIIFVKKLLQIPHVISSKDPDDSHSLSSPRLTLHIYRSLVNSCDNVSEIS